MVVAAATLVFAGCSSGSDGEASTDITAGESAALQEQWLFSLQSGGITTFDESSGVLSVPVGNLVGFTDRPYRDERDLTPTEFAALWADNRADSFSVDPPNASLTYWSGDGTDAVASTVIVEITGLISGAGDVLSMELQILSPSDAVLPDKLYRASLFVDSVTGVSGGMRS